MSDTATNQEALDSAIYNPGYDDTDIAVYNIITNNMSEDTYNQVLARYTSMWYNLPTVNQYEGMLQSPIECDAADINNDINDITSILNSVPSTDPEYSQISDPNNPNSILSQITGGTSTSSIVSSADITSVPGNAFISANNDGTYTATTYANNSAISPGISSASDHINRIIGNLPMMLALAQTAMGALTALGNLNNPCINLGNFFGSINGIAKEITGFIKDIVSQIKSYIDAGLAVIKEAMQEIQNLLQQALNYVNKLLNTIKNEINQFIKSLIDSIKFTLSSFLKSLKLDPCAKSILKSVSTAAGLFAI